jgi:uncharacterized membrane protein YtjA (UPF0391 family)
VPRASEQWKVVTTLAPQRRGITSKTDTAQFPLATAQFLLSLDEKAPLHGGCSSEEIMLHYALVFLVVALIAGLLGVSGVAAVATNIAYILFVVAIVLFLVHLLSGRRTLVP